MSEHKIFLPVVRYADNFRTEAEWYISRHPQQQRTTLIPSPVLAEAAQHRCISLATRGYFAHCDPDGVCPNQVARAFGVPLTTRYPHNGNSIESLVAGVESPIAAAEALLNSPKHRAHLLGESEFYRAQTFIGVGYYRLVGSPHQFYYCFHIAEFQV